MKNRFKKLVAMMLTILTPLEAPVLNASGDFNITEGETVSIDWNQVENATAYSIIVWDFTGLPLDATYAPEVDRVNDQEGLTYSYTFNKAGIYIIGVYSRCPGSTEYCQSRTPGAANVCVTANAPVCSHTNVTAYYDNGVQTPLFSNITETHHDVQNGYMMYCEDCKQYTGEKGYFDAVPEQHIFTNGDVCVCGYDRSSCEHKATADSTKHVGIICQQNDAATHYVIADKYMYTCEYCKRTDCIAVIPRSEDQWELKEHEWDKVGVCQSEGCGFECVHEYAVHYYKPVSGTGKFTYTKDGHTKVAVDYEQYCKLCGLRGPDYTDNTINDFGKHWYGTDKYSYDDSHHWLTNLACRGQCGYTRSSTKAEHALDSQGECDVCGYENAELSSQEAFRNELYKLYEEMIRTVDEASIVDYCTIDTSSAGNAVITFGSASVRRASASLSELLFDDFIERVKGDGSNDYLNTAAVIAELLGFYYDEQHEIVEAMVLTEILEAEVEANLYYTAIKKNGDTIAKIIKRGASDDLSNLEKGAAAISNEIERIREQDIINYFHDEYGDHELNDKRLAELQAELSIIKKGIASTEKYVIGISSAKQMFDLGGHFYEEYLEYNTLVYMRKNVREKLVTLSRGIADETLRAAVEEYIKEIDNAFKYMLMSDCVYILNNAQSYANTYYQFTNYLYENGILKNKTAAQKAIQAAKEKWEDVTNQIKENKIIGFGADALKAVKKAVNYFEIASMFGNMMYSIDDLVHLYDVISYERLALKKQADRILSYYNHFYDASEITINKPNLNSEIISAIALTSAAQTHLHKYWNTIYNDTYIVDDGFSVFGFFEIYKPEWDDCGSSCRDFS